MGLSYLEDFDSQIPAIQLLHALGWKYLSREEALKLRGGRESQVILTEVLSSWLESNNTIEARGESHSFTDANIHEAIRRLTDEPFDGLVRTNEKLYHLLTLGTSLDQTVTGERKGRSLKYIDWEHPENNKYHVSDELSVERRFSHDTRRPDIVLFVNGIPFVVIECKRRDKDQQAGERQIDVAIQQQLRNQKEDEIPHLFQFAQLLIATSVNEVRYGTVGTPKNFWAVWREDGQHDQAIHAAANQRLPADVESRLFAPLESRHANAYREARKYFEELWAAGDRLPTEQDKCLWAMLRPERLMKFLFGYVVFDAGVRKVARHQQFFAVQTTLAKVSAKHEGRRSGGVIWHTTGSGKSLTMVMLAKALALHPGITNPRVVLITDRVDLDDQLWATFEACGKSAVRAKTGAHLVRLITEGKAGVITTVIDKFSTVMSKHNVVDPNPNIFVLVDEGHRSNYGPTAAKMRRVFPNACFIGFTGTPLLKKDKNTARKFGGIIHSYTMRQAAVEDGAVLPLLYEGRIAALEQNKEAMQLWFDLLTENLNQDQKADLKKKMATKEVIHKAEQRLKMIAYDISKHYRDNFQGTGFKAQLAADSRTSAILYRRFLNAFGMVNCEVIMSQPDTRKGTDSLEEEDDSLVNQFWGEMMKRFGSEKQYLKQILASFGREDGVEILIVVDKLLTGFDEPRNTVLYVDKTLKEHNILQALARVNRLYPNKDFGYIIDYRGILGDLNEVMNIYEALAGFDADDVDLSSAVIDSHAEVARLPQLHSDLWAIFKEVANKKDVEAFEQHLKPDDRRQGFYEALKDFQKCLMNALSTEHFYDDVPQDRIKVYSDDMKFFRGLRASVQQRYAEVVDYSQYEKQIRKVMDSHIQAPDVGIVTELVNIFDTEAFDKEVEKREGKAAKADTIASRLKKTITEKMDEDPVFYKKFADLVQKAIDDYSQHRIDDVEYLRCVSNILETIRRGHESDMPQWLDGHREAQAYFGVLTDVLMSPNKNEAHVDEVREDESEYAIEALQSLRDKMADMALAIESLIEEKKIRDWVHNQSVINDMKNAIDDYLFDLRDARGICLNTTEMDVILERCLGAAQKQAST